MRKISSTRARLAAVAVTAVGGLAVAGAALGTGASAASTAQPSAAITVATAPTASAATGYRFTTLDNAHDVTFNQLLGINNEGEIAGYFGSGAADHPNKGYDLFPPRGQGNYVNENFPGSVQTQVTGLNDAGDLVGFYVDAAGNTDGFLAARQR